MFMYIYICLNTSTQVFGRVSFGGNGEGLTFKSEESRRNRKTRSYVTRGQQHNQRRHDKTCRAARSSVEISPRESRRLEVEVVEA